MKYLITKIWREQTNHSSNCLLCNVDLSKRRAGKNALVIIYLGLLLSITPVHHCLELLVRIRPKRKQPSSEENSNLEENEVIVPG